MGSVGSVAVESSSNSAMEKEQRRPPVSRTAPVAMKASSASATAQGIRNRSQSRRERKIALQQDVDKLRKKLRHEENVHRALERAFTRPLGALPRLPPYLPSQTLELLAEVAVLEEEVVRLEEQVVNFRQGLYQEAIITSMAKSAYFPDGDRCTPARHKTPAQVQSSEVSTSSRQASDQDAADWSSLKRATNVKQTPRRPGRSLSHGDCPGKENQSCGTNSCRDFGRAPLSNVPKCRAPPAEKCAGVQTTSTVEDHKAIDGSNGIDSDTASTAANKVSEELLTCLLTILSQMSTSGSQDEERASSPSVSGSCESSSDGACAGTGDPYGVLDKFGWRDIGRYKQFRSVDAASFDTNVSAGDAAAAAALGRRLKALLRKLSSVDLVGLSHQQRLAFWINTYNSCMMNAFLEHGAPTNPHTLVAMMTKATINVGGRVLSAMTIEHFVLRLPYDAKHVNAEGAKSEYGMAVLGLEWPEPLVTFALSCGSWSSPAVRVYTAGRVEEELEAAKREYLEAAVGVSPAGGLAIPKLLHWCLPDFAKDAGSLVDWVCLQLPRELQRDAVRAAAAAPPVRVLPYEFRFRYLLAS
ncbi:hypothetical protein PAHAL_6G236600 [Panicum hallii]|uniref:Ternary complex factor MIP1 leucine-zipper domain-containing protein n=1 Tax=Panicum hallii TaxID=206008 RepID=A0A2S3I404_9POAL|nr:uncharacterized protein LOC112898548 isoform X2 [Panicum hallii]PAN35816.1 hypothetical protein PAHAL_6G236600 [Panicum hallii]